MEPLKRLQHANKSVCANPNCRANKNLTIAPSFVSAYYGFAIDDQVVRKVCQACYESAEGHQNQLLHLLLSKQSFALHCPKKSNNSQVEVVSIDDDEDTERVEEDHQAEPLEELEVEEDLGLFVNNLMEKYDFNGQLEASIEKMESNLADNDVKQVEIDELTANLEKDIDQFRNDLYSNYEPQIQHVDAIDITEVPEGSDSSSVSDASASPVISPRPAVKLPPNGVLHFPKVKRNHSVYAMKTSLLAPWIKGLVVKTEEGPETLCTVQFDNGGRRKFPLKYLAYVEPNPVRLTLGSRVIAQCFEEKDGKTPSAYYAGVIAEAPSYVSQNRYLVFFDDGYSQYCHHEQVLMVCHRAHHVWHDVHTDSRPFVSNYLKQFPERAMVRLQSGQRLKVELNGRWFMAVVQTVDASLARILFISENISQWIYRGSTRLYPLFEMLAIAEARKNQGATRPSHNLALTNRRKNAPYVEFTLRNVDSPSTSVPLAARSPGNSNENGVKAVARKSSGKKLLPKSSRLGLSKSTVHGKKEDQGRIIILQNEMYQDIAFEPHQCGFGCVSDFPYTEANFKNVNPLNIPMKCGWSREVTKRTHNGRRNIVYRGPCGRRMRNMDEVHRYLRLTRCELSVDLFCYDSFVHCFTEFQPDDVQSQLEDIAYGQEERVLVSCVNSIDTSLPEYVEYTTQRIPREGVDLNLDPSFLVCCDCTDDCQDKEKCQCWQLTLQSGCPSGTISQNSGYQFRRLYKNVRTGVYECNSQCACRKTCLNRVAQRPLQLRLQLFRTEKRGWGIRCLDDIPEGEFICIYSGHLLTHEEANKDGAKYGDEYLFDLDLIETSENTKEGYESDVESFSSHCSGDDLDSCGSSVNYLLSLDHSEIQSNRESNAKQNFTSDVSIEPASELKRVSEEMEDSPNKTRELYGANENCYVMDAKTIGNIGRYLNHCCSPNVFSQSVFLDSQDLRFHWVGFFAINYIRAGTELTWDYNYTVNSVENKKIECHCGSKICRGRLL